MDCLIDVGNSRIKWAFAEREDFCFGGSCAWRGRDLGELCSRMWSQVAPPSRILVSNVAGRAIQEVISGWCETCWRRPAEFLSTGSKGYGIVNGYSRPEQLGIDRWLAMIAAYHVRRGALAVVDCGTAMTIDVLDDEGVHLGGLIVPGIGLMGAALDSGTDAVTLAAQGDAGLLAHDTAAGVATGSRLALAALIDHVVTSLATQMGSAPSCLLSGGEAPRILPGVAVVAEHHPHLVLNGLALVASA